MSMPGFTAEVSLNESRGRYAMTPQDAFARSGLVFGQQFEVFARRTYYLELVCPSCYPFGHPTVDCEVFRVGTSFFHPTRTSLGTVRLPQNCWYQCVEAPR
jgi:hypothetical protein